MKRGEVYYLKTDESYGHEMGIGRPVMIITADEYIDKFPTVTVAYLTTSSTRFGMKVRLRTPNRQSWVRCDQVYTVDKERLSSFMCKLKEDEIDAVDDAIRLVNGLKYETEAEEVETPITIDDGEKTRLQIELDLYKKLYADLTSQIVDARFERQVVVAPEVEIPKKENVCKAEKIIVDDLVEKVEPKVVEEPQPQLEITDLAKKMSTPNIELDEPPKKKMGRPIGSKNKPKKANINKDDEETIIEITGMSPQTAHEIIKWRKKNGPFVDLTDLLFVPRFGNGCMNKYGQMLEA